MPARRKPNEVPQIIKQMSKAADDDLAPTIDLFARILFGGRLNPEPAPRERTPVVRSRLPPSRNLVRHGITIKEVNVGQSRPPAPTSKPPIADAEIVENHDFSPICPTCGGEGKLGRPGYEVPCPTCK